MDAEKRRLKTKALSARIGVNPQLIAFLTNILSANHQASKTQSLMPSANCKILPAFLASTVLPITLGE